MVALVATQKQSPVDTLAKIEAWPHWSTIQQLAKKEYGLPEARFQCLLGEYQKFMGLIALGYKGVGMFSTEIDIIWHSHVLHTPLYQQFCEHVIGHFVHHFPNSLPNHQLSCVPDTEPPADCIPTIPDTEPPSGFTAERFAQIYRSVYGEVPGQLWGLTIADGFAA